MCSDRVGGGITPAVLPHHRTCGSASGGSCLLGRNQSAAASSFRARVAWLAMAPRAPLGPPAPPTTRRLSVAADFRPACAETTRDYPLMTGSALRRLPARLLWPRLTSGDPSR